MPWISIERGPSFNWPKCAFWNLTVQCVHHYGPSYQSEKVGPETRFHRGAVEMVVKRWFWPCLYAPRQLFRLFRENGPKEWAADRSLPPHRAEIGENLYTIANAISPGPFHPSLAPRKMLLFRLNVSSMHSHRDHSDESLGDQIERSN